MIPVDQTTFSPEGNCWAAAIASLLEVPIETVPDFASEDGWRAATSEWLEAGYGKRLLAVHCGPILDHLVPDCWHLICGTSPRGIPHATVGFAGRIIHDPHPSRAGLLHASEWYFLMDVKEHDAWKSRYNAAQALESETEKASVPGNTHTPEKGTE